MHLRSVDIENVRAIRSLSWVLPEERQTRGWHVILGNNGSGKSSFLRAAALALVGPEDLHGLRQRGEDWLRRGCAEGSIGVVFERHPEFDRFSTRGAPPRELGAFVRIAPSASGVQISAEGERSVRGRGTERSVWAPDATGWFVAGFGPFRRFAGGDDPTGKPSLARNLSLFDERFALRGALSWLVDLWVAKIAKTSAPSFDLVRAFINQPGLLPHGVRLDRVELEPEKRVVMLDGSGIDVPIEEMSDGFRSVLSLTLEVLRQLIGVFGVERTFSADGARVVAPGVLLIDEIDAHLHPTWQRQIGDFLLRAFPEMQFVVTTHSPLVCRSARDGTVFLLPEPGTNETGRMLDDVERDRLALGNLLDAYATGAFGVGVEQSDEGARAAARLAELNSKELFGAPLSEGERAERAELRARLPSRAAATSSKAVDALVAQIARSSSTASGG